jgi:hypothetical protein|tara:strand:+ start:411 stop:671 length:261 start_codon:yes stop_codon:yes gene_type:complete
MSKKLDKVLSIDLHDKISKYFDGKLWANNPEGIKKQDKRAKELLNIANEINSLQIDTMFLNVWNQHFDIEEEDWNDLQIEKVFYHR